jgi:2-keto-3-deoxy-6-phosphogluconate aldolase
MSEAAVARGSATEKLLSSRAGTGDASLVNRHSVDDAAQYLALPIVGCVGGSWITPSDVVAAQDWARVTGLAAAAATL